MVSAASRQAERLEKKLQNALRECQKKPGNKRCADCTERVSLELDFWFPGRVFVYSTVVRRLGPKQSCVRCYPFASRVSAIYFHSFRVILVLGCCDDHCYLVPGTVPRLHVPISPPPRLLPLFCLPLVFAAGPASSSFVAS